MTVSEARAALPQLLDRVVDGEEVTLTRHGKPIAVVVRPDVLRVRRTDQSSAVLDRLREALDKGRRAPLAPRPAIEEEWAEELIADVRADRSSR